MTLALPSRELWTPNGAWWRLPRFLEHYTAGKLQRNPATGKIQRNPATGKLIRNTATETTCCCGDCCDTIDADGACQHCGDVVPKAWKVNTTSRSYCSRFGGMTSWYNLISVDESIDAFCAPETNLAGASTPCEWTAYADRLTYTVGGYGGGPTHYAYRSIIQISRCQVGGQWGLNVVYQVWATAFQRYNALFWAFVADAGCETEHVITNQLSGVDCDESVPIYEVGCSYGNVFVSGFLDTITITPCLESGI